MLNDKDYKAVERQFDTYYEGIVLPKLQQIEVKRKEMLRIFCSLSVFVILWIGFVVKQLMEHSGKYLSEYGLLSCIIILLACWPMFSYYRKSKESLLPILASFWGNFDYSYQKSFPEKIIQQSRIIKSYDRFLTDDCFEGIYKDVPVSVFEYELYKRGYRHYNGRTSAYYYKSAQGILFKARMNKEFQGQTIIVKDSGFFNKFKQYKNLQRVGLESPEFEKAFEVYSDNQVEARYLLTTVMLEYVMKLKTIFPKIELSFFAEHVLINIETKKNMFECSSFFHSIINKKRIYQNFEELYLLFSIIECLHLTSSKKA